MVNKIKDFTEQKEGKFDIPSMSSNVSQTITDYKQSHQQLVDESVEFFAAYISQMTTLAEYKRNMAAYKKQIDTIENYKKEHGKLPQIRGQKSSAKYLNSLHIKSENLYRAYKSLIKDITSKRKLRYEMLDQLADNIIDMLESRTLFSQFLGTIALSTPLPEEKIRCVRNEKFKPIYTAALVVALFDQIRSKHSFKNPYLKKQLDTLFDQNSPEYMLHDEENSRGLPENIKLKYRQEVLKPITKAALIYSVGSYAPEVESIFDGDRYRLLDAEQRQALIDSTHQKSLDYLKVGIGLPLKRYSDPAKQKDFVTQETEKLRFMLMMLNSHFNGNHELDDLLRIPMVYSSFIVSTKPGSDYRLIYKAYDIIEDGIRDKIYDEPFARQFLSMVGQFPVGSGIYFISKETEHIEKAIVSSLFPEKVDTPVCKQITRNQNQSLSQFEVVITSTTNIYYQQTRDDSTFDDNYFAQRFDNDFTWNANELWEVQIPAVKFWKKRGVPKVN